jgi:hypothetical protein
MIYSHFYDLLAKLVLLALVLLIWIPIEPFMAHTIVLLGAVKESQVTFFSILFMIAISVLLLAWVYVPWLSPAAAWCYLRFSLRTPVDWATAKTVESMFRPTLQRLEWYPMKDIKKLAPEERIPTILQLFDQLQTQKTTNY